MLPTPYNVQPLEIVQVGDSSLVPYLARGASGVGIDGLFFETHFNPSVALLTLSNGENIDRV